MYDEKAYKREYALANKEHLREYRRRRYLEQRERILAVNAAYRKANPEKIAQGKKDWADRNREKLKEQRNAKRRANPEARRLREAKYREWAREYRKQKYKENAEAIKTRTRAYHWKNRDKIAMIKRTKAVQKWLERAGWSWEEYERRLARGCEICGGHNKIVFDHDHETGYVRGLLCCRCNRFLDWAIEYYETIGCYHRISIVEAA